MQSLMVPYLLVGSRIAILPRISNLTLESWLHILGFLLVFFAEEVHPDRVVPSGIRMARGNPLSTIA